MFLWRGSSRKTCQIQTPEWQAHESDTASAPCLSKQDTPGHAEQATSELQGYEIVFPHTTPRLATLIHSFIMLLAYHTGTCFSNCENWKNCVKFLHHTYHKLIHFKALILISETSPELWLGFQGKTPFFFNASFHQSSCHKQHVTAQKTFRLAEGKATTSFTCLKAAKTLRKKSHRTYQIILPRSCLNHMIKIHW